jgi:hypothetical protein
MYNELKFTLVITHRDIKVDAAASVDCVKE